jgi:hypothetical protein
MLCAGKRSGYGIVDLEGGAAPTTNEVRGKKQFFGGPTSNIPEFRITP